MRSTLRVVILSLTTLAIPALAQWQAAPAFDSSTSGRQHAVGLRLGGTLYAVGGPPWVNGGDEDGSVHTLALGSGSWITQIELDGVGGFIRQGGGIDNTGQIMIFGGYNPTDPNGDPADPFHYDIIEGPSGGLMPRGAAAPNDYFAWCTDSAGRVYSFGGGDGPAAHSGNPNSGYAERYIGTSDIWEVLAPMPTPAADACAVADANGYILVIGGYDANANTRMTNVAQYDIANDTWSDVAVPDLPVGLTGAKAVLGADDRVWVMGGEVGPVSAGTVVNTCYVLDVDGLQWSAGPVMAEARKWFGAVLRDDDHIYVLGGVTQTGGTDNCEKIYTTPCPIFSTVPADTTAWTTQRATLTSAAIGGGTITYQWFRDGSTLSDGPTGTGSELLGTQTTTLVIDNIGQSDAAEYYIEASNSCGTTASAIAVLTVRTTPELPDNWTVTNLHPAWATEGSRVQDVHNGQQVGSGSILVDLYDTTYTLGQPTIWNGDANSAVSVTAVDSVGGDIAATNGTTQAGWWWRPYRCRVGGQWTTCYSQQAARWHGTAASHENLQASGWEYSYVSAVGDTHLGGHMTNDDDVGNVWFHAALWTTEGATHPQDLHPTEFRSSSITAIDGDFQYGGVLTNFPFTNKAAKWHGTRDSYVNMHPAAASRSGINDAADGQQVGYAVIADENRPLLWHGLAEEFVDLLPIGASGGTVVACDGGLQTGSVTFADGGHLVVWAGHAEAFVDLKPFVAAPLINGYITSIDVEADGTIVVGGLAYNQDAEVFNAIIWTSSDTPPCDADFNGDGDVNTLDVLAFLNAWVAGDPAADFNNDGDVNTLDVLAFLNAWTTGC